MHILKAFQHLIDDVLLMNIFEDVCADHSVQVRVHEIEYKVYIAVVLGTDHILKSDDVFMARQFLQEDNLSECALGISCVLKSIEILLKGHNILRLLINGLPNDSVGSLPYR